MRYIANGYICVMSKESETISIRFPLELSKNLKERATKENRSFNNMVITILKENITTWKTL